MSKLLLVTFSDNYADEFDIHGFKIMAESEYEELLETAERAIKQSPGEEHYFGTNEYVSYESFSEYKGTLSARKISVEEAQIIARLFDLSEIRGKFYGEFGHFITPEPDEDEDWCDDEDEDEDEDE